MCIQKNLNLIAFELNTRPPKAPSYSIPAATLAKIVALTG